MGKLTTRVIGVVATVAVIATPVVHAQLSISLDDNAGNTYTATDSSDSGAVGFFGSLGSGVWTANLTGGFEAGSAYLDEFDLLSGNTSSAGSTGTLTVMLSQTDLLKSDVQWITAAGGTTDGNISFKSWIDPNNTAFGRKELISEQGPITGSGQNGAFAVSDTGFLTSLSGPYSWTIVATINHTGEDGLKKVTSFDYNVKIPEPSTLALLGFGLIGAGIAARRKTKQ